MAGQSPILPTAASPWSHTTHETPPAGRHVWRETSTRVHVFLIEPKDEHDVRQP